MFYLQKFFKICGNKKREFAKFSVLSLVAGIMELFGVALIYPFVLNLLKNNGGKYAALLALLIVALFILKNVFMIFYTYLQTKLAKNVEEQLALNIVRYFLTAPYTDSAKIEYAKKMNIINFVIPNVVNNYLMRLLNLSVNFFIFGLIVLLLAVKYPLATVITAVFAFMMICLQDRVLKPCFSNMSKNISAVFSDNIQKINDILLNIKGVKVSNNEKFFYENCQNIMHKYYSYSAQKSFYEIVPPYITEPFIIILLFILLVVISVQNFAEPDKLFASFAVIAAAIFRLAPTVSRIQVNLNGINLVLPMVDELFNMFETLGVAEAKTPSIKEFCEFNSTIELKDVEFAYENKPVLKNINLVVNKGEYVGITGLSGAGKTTLLDIIAGLNKPNKGEIYVDSKPQNAPLKIGYITQEYIPVNGSIRENVAFGFSQIDDEAVVDSLKKAQLYDYIVENFEEGIYANPFSDSTGLSQGQKQRLAIARALYTNPDILILDEATSSLDLKTEDEICNVLTGLKGKKTIIVVAHRLSTIKSADKIVYVKNAEIEAIAAFDELFNNNDDFRKLVNLASFK